MAERKEFLWPYVQSLGLRRKEYEGQFEPVPEKKTCPCAGSEIKNAVTDENILKTNPKNIQTKNLFAKPENKFLNKLQKSDPFLYGELNSEPPGHFIPRIKRDRHLTTYQIDFMGLEKCYTDNDTMLNLPIEPKCIPDSRGIGCTYLDCMKRYKDRVSQIEGETGKTQTYGELLVQCVRAARGLKAHGILTHHVVSMCSLNHMDACIPLMASMLIGAKFCSLHPTLAPADCLHIMMQVKPKIIFVGQESIVFMETLLAKSGLKSELIVFGDSQKYMSFEEFSQIETGDEWNFEATPAKNDHDTAIILLSSGTTDRSKCFEIPHYGLLYNCSYLMFGRTHKVIMYFSSYYWISGVMCLTIATTHGMARVTGMFSPQNMMKFIEQYKVNLTFAPPFLVYLLFKMPELFNYDTSSLTEMVVGGDRIGVDQMCRLRKKMPHTNFLMVYGLTESCGVLAFFRPQDTDLMKAKPKSSGRFTSGVIIRVVDPDTGQILGPNREGEIIFKSQMCTNGYYNNRERSESELWDKDGFIHTGDIGYYDEDYCLYIVDRIKEMLKYDGWQIAPGEIEKVLHTHPAVESAVVVGKTAFEHGDLPMAAVVLRRGASAREEDIVNYCNARVPERQKLRAGVVFVDRIPLTPTGKIWRRKAREMILQIQLKKNETGIQ